MPFDPDRKAHETEQVARMAEDAVIAACLLSDDAFPTCDAIIGAEDFLSEAMRRVWEACERLHGRSKVLTVISVSYELAQVGALEFVGAEPALQAIVGRWFTAEGVEAYADVVKAESGKRAALQQASRAAAAAGRGDQQEAQRIMRGEDDQRKRGPGGDYGTGASSGPAGATKPWWE